MAKYAVSQEGVASVRQLQNDLKNNNENIRNACSTLQNVVSGVGSRIGIFEGDINTLINAVRTAQQTGEQGIEELSNKLGQLASAMEGIIAKGLS